MKSLKLCSSTKLSTQRAIGLVLSHTLAFATGAWCAVSFILSLPIVG